MRNVIPAEGTLVRVDRTLTPDQVIDKTGFTRGLINGRVLVTMPGVGEGPEEIEVSFFDLDYKPTPAQLDNEYGLRGMEADVAATAQAVGNNPGLVDVLPIACQWGFGGFYGAASFAVFFQEGARFVHVRRNFFRWGPYVRFAGVQK